MEDEKPNRADYVDAKEYQSGAYGRWYDKNDPKTARPQQRSRTPRHDQGRGTPPIGKPYLNRRRSISRKTKNKSGNISGATSRIAITPIRSFAPSQSNAPELAPLLIQSASGNWQSSVITPTQMSVRRITSAAENMRLKTPMRSRPSELNFANRTEPPLPNGRGNGAWKTEKNSSVLLRNIETKIGISSLSKRDSVARAIPIGPLISMPIARNTTRKTNTNSSRITPYAKSEYGVQRRLG